MARYYQQANGSRLPSVTTILGATRRNAGALLGWLRRPDARELSKAACDRGTAVHELAERYLKGTRRQRVTEAARPYWRRLRPELAKIDARFRELPVAHPLGYAGTLDIYGVWRGTRATLIDIKTIGNPAQLSDRAGDWFCQLAAYAAALESSYGCEVQQAVVLAASVGGLQVVRCDRASLEDSWLEFLIRLDEYRLLESQSDRARRAITTAFDFSPAPA